MARFYPRMSTLTALAKRLIEICEVRLHGLRTFEAAIRADVSKGQLFRSATERRMVETLQASYVGMKRAVRDAQRELAQMDLSSDTAPDSLFLVDSGLSQAREKIGNAIALSERVMLLTSLLMNIGGRPPWWNVEPRRRRRQMLRVVKDTPATKEAIPLTWLSGGLPIDRSGEK